MTQRGETRMGWGGMTSCVLWFGDLCSLWFLAAQWFMSYQHREDADPRQVDGERLGHVSPGKQGAQLPGSRLCVTRLRICGPAMLVSISLSGEGRTMDGFVCLCNLDRRAWASSCVRRNQTWGRAAGFFVFAVGLEYNVLVFFLRAGSVSCLRNRCWKAPRVVEKRYRSESTVGDWK